MFSAQPGFVGVIFAGAGADRAVITLWRDRHSVEALRESDSYKRTVAKLEAIGILAAGSSVEALEVISPLHIELSEIVRGGLMSDGQEDVRRREGRDHPSAGQRQTAAALPNPLQSVKSSYDAVAAEYAQRISGELEGKPFDRALLDEIAAGATGLICDLGCGPGHVAHYLHQRGAAVLGIDLSPAMIAEARRRYPTLRFETGDIRSLSHEDNTFGAAVAMYSLIHFGDRELADALREVHRTLVPGGLFLASFHRGTGVVHHDELFGHPVNQTSASLAQQILVPCPTATSKSIVARTRPQQRRRGRDHPVLHPRHSLREPVSLRRCPRTQTGPTAPAFMMPALLTSTSSRPSSWRMRSAAASVEA